jgi:hypothetical protein
VDDQNDALKKWMDEKGLRTAKQVADSLAISRSAADRAIRGTAGELALRRILDRIELHYRLDPALGSAMLARIIVGLQKLGHSARRIYSPDVGADMMVDGVLVEIRVHHPDDHGREFFDRLAGLPPEETD